MSNINVKDYSDKFNTKDFWSVVKKGGKAIPFLRDALAMYYCFMDPETPVWVKGLIVGALGYFIFPFDAVPDFIPIAGWLDDAGVIAIAMQTIRSFIKPEHWAEADKFLG